MESNSIPLFSYAMRFGCGYIKNSRLRVGYAVNRPFTKNYTAIHGTEFVLNLESM